MKKYTICQLVSPIAEIKICHHLLAGDPKINFLIDDLTKGEISKVVNWHNTTKIESKHYRITLKSKDEFGLTYIICKKEAVIV